MVISLIGPKRSLCEICLLSSPLPWLSSHMRVSAKQTPTDLAHVIQSRFIADVGPRGQYGLMTGPAYSGPVVGPSGRLSSACHDLGNRLL